jgi:phosphate transport system substrate-binding protein
MKFAQKHWILTSTAALVAGSITIGMPAVQSQGQSTIKIDGSSTVYPLTEAVAEEFQKAQKGKIRVTVGVSGTGGGFEKFCSGQTDISNASRPIKKSEMDACKSSGVSFIELPVAHDALTVVVNKQNNWATNITTEELKKMWEPSAQGKITKWNQIRSSWPNANIKLYGPGTDSGTFDYFTSVINGKSGASRADYTASENDNVLVQGVASDRNAIGYFGYSYYEENKNKLKALSINGVNPSVQAVHNDTYKPLSRFIYIYVSSKSMGRPEVKQFVEYYINNTNKFAQEVRSVPLESGELSKAKQRLQARTLGSAVTK